MPENTTTQFGVQQLLQQQLQKNLKKLRVLKGDGGAGTTRQNLINEL